MEIRYLGFQQQQNLRVYEFDLIEKGHPCRRFAVTTDLNLFLANHVGIQEGPTLCATKLIGDLEKNFEGIHELTDDDLRSHAVARSQAIALKAEMRKPPRRRAAPPEPGDQRSPWRLGG